MLTIFTEAAHDLPGGTAGCRTPYTGQGGGRTANFLCTTYGGGLCDRLSSLMILAMLIHDIDTMYVYRAMYIPVV